jgi:hypothetical protein
LFNAEPRDLMILAFGAVMLALALAWRFGLWPVGATRKAKWYHQWYRNPNVPRWRRGGGAAAIPIAAGFLTAGAAVALDDLRASWMAFLALLVVSLALFVLGAVVMFLTPAWLKPAWVRKEDRLRAEGQAGEVDVPEEGTTPTMARWELAVVLVVAAVSIAGVAYWRWPPALLVGVGMAVSSLALYRVRR